MIADLRPHSEMKESGLNSIGATPKHWEIGRLKSVCSMKSGEGITAMSIEPAGNFPVYGGNGLRGYTSHYTHNGSFVLIGRQGALCGNVHLAKGKFWASEHAVVATTRDGHLPGWLAAIVGAMNLNQYSMAAAQPGLSVERVLDLRIPIPPAAEQADIVRFLDHADHSIQCYISAKQKLIALLSEGRSALISQTVTRGLDSDVDTRATRSHVFPSVPRAWRLWKIRHLIQRVRRPIVVEADKEYREIGIRSWGKGVFHKEKVRGAILGEKNVFRVEPGDFVLNIVFAWEGAVALVSENEKGMIASHRFPTFRPSAEVDIDYLLMIFQSEQGRRLMEVNSPGAAGRNKTLRIGQLLDEEIPVPALDEQRMIVATFRKEEQRIAECVTRTCQAIHQLEEFRSRLIADVVTGKVDVRAVAGGLPETDPATTGRGPYNEVIPQDEDARPGVLRVGPA